MARIKYRDQRAAEEKLRRVSDPSLFQNRRNAGGPGRLRFDGFKTG